MTMLRKTTPEDVNQVMEIIEQGKSYLKSSGVDQWQNGYPNEAVIQEDLVNGYGYVLECEGEVVGTAALSFDGEPWYDDIRGGEWLSDDNFLVIHRLAVSRNVRGTDVASLMIKQCEKLCAECNVHSIKIDTHEDNIIMQKFVKKMGLSIAALLSLVAKVKD